MKSWFVAFYGFFDHVLSVRDVKLDSTVVNDASKSVGGLATLVSKTLSAQTQGVEPAKVDADKKAANVDVIKKKRTEEVEKAHAEWLTQAKLVENFNKPKFLLSDEAQSPIEEYIALKDRCDRAMSKKNEVSKQCDVDVAAAETAARDAANALSELQSVIARLEALEDRCKEALFVRFLVTTDEALASISVRFFDVDLGAVRLSCGPVPADSIAWIDVTRLSSLAVVGSNGCGKSRFGQRLAEVIKRKLTAEAPFITARRGIDAKNGSFEDICAKLATGHATAIAVAQTSPLAKLMPFWRMVFKDLELSLVPASNIEVKLQVTRTLCNDHPLKPYDPAELSDGEKGILMLLYHLFFDDHSNRFRVVIVDEPEAHLHLALVDQFWLEIERALPNVLFVYISHDLAFASSRFHPFRRCLTVSQVCTNRKCEPNESAVFSTDDIGFLVAAIPFGVDGTYDFGVADRVLGVRRQNILFIEGTSDSVDACVYTFALRNWLVTPMMSCKDVKCMVASGNRDRWMAPTNTNVANVYGLIDYDYGEHEAMPSISCSPLAIAENLYATPQILQLAFNTGDEASTNEAVRKFEKAARSLALERYDNQATQFASSPKKKNLTRESIAEALGVKLKDGRAEDVNYDTLLKRWKSKKPSTDDPWFDWTDVFATVGGDWEQHKALVAHKVFVDKDDGPWVEAVRAWVPVDILNAESDERQKIGRISADPTVKLASELKKTQDEVMELKNRLKQQDTKTKEREVELKRQLQERDAENARLKEALAGLK